MTFVACTDSDDSGKSRTPEINLEANAADFVEDGGSVIVYFTSTDAWTASVDSGEWCSVKPESGNAGRVGLIISASVNDETDNRTTSISIKSGTIEKSISVSQGRKSVIAFEEDTYAIESEGGSFDVEVNYSVNFDVTIDCDWITRGETRALEKDNITFVVAENPTNEARTGHITFTSKNGTISQKITATQKGGIFEMYYTSHNEQIVTPNINFNVVSNTYENGKGVIIFSEKLTVIASEMFKGCNTLKSIEIPAGVTEIGSSAFSGCELLKSIIIPEGVVSIGTNAFSECKLLSNISIPNGVVSIGSYAFYGCESLNSIIIPEGVTSIDNGTFKYCDSLENVTIPESVITIGQSSFQFCDSLENIIIPESVTSIGKSTFYGCNSLKNINIPNGITSIEEKTFEYCRSLVNITIPESVAAIGSSAFSECISLKSIVIPNGVSVIENSTFYCCYSLENIAIPESVTSIGVSAFYSCI